MVFKSLKPSPKTLSIQVQKWFLRKQPNLSELEYTTLLVGIFHGLSKKSSWCGFKQDPKKNLNPCPGARSTVPSKHDTRASTLSLASTFIAVYVSLFIYPLFRCLAMCRLIYYYVCISSSFSFYGAYCTALYSFSFNELVHELIFERVHLFTGRILSIQ